MAVVLGFAALIIASAALRGGDGGGGASAPGRKKCFICNGETTLGHVNHVTGNVETYSCRACGGKGYIE
jgi:hypothetical protein